LHISSSLGLSRGARRLSATGLIRQQPLNPLSKRAPRLLEPLPACFIRHALSTLMPQGRKL